MRKSSLLLAALMAMATVAFAQQELSPGSDTGPMLVKPAPPTPGSDGVYRLDSGVTPPVLVRPVAAAYPADAADNDRPHGCLISAVIDAHGQPTKIQAVNAHDNAYDEAAIEAVRNSQFQPGSLNGKPVPVLVYLRVSFSRLGPALPRMLPRYPQMAEGQLPRQSDPDRLRPGDTPPKAISIREAEFSDEARRRKIQGVVLVSLLVTEEGMPTDIRVEKSVGAGLDENAVKAVSKYRFKPATHNGEPVAARIHVEVNFRLY